MHFADFGRIFENSPVIYSLLTYILVLALFLWAYSLLTLRLSEIMPESFVQEIHPLLKAKKFDAALEVCQAHALFSSSIIASGIKARDHGPDVIIKVMEAEGRRSASGLWHKVKVLEEVATVAPMLGLLGTALGYFFFYFDSDRNFTFLEVITQGFTFAIQTTLFGFFVSFLTWIFYATLKFRVTQLLDAVEKEALSTVEFLRNPDGT